MSEGFSNPVLGGEGALIRAEVMSPNFNIANPPASPAQSWALLKNGLAYLFGVKLSGGTLTGPDYILDPTGFYFYSGAPALGNLPIAWISESATDPVGNALPAPAKDFVSFNHATNALVWMTHGGIGLQLTSDNAPGAMGVSGGTGSLLLKSPGVIPGDFQAAAELHSVHSSLNVSGSQEMELTAGTVLTAGASKVPVVSGLSVTNGTVTDTLHATGTSTLDGAVTANAGETITAGGLAVTGGTTTDTLNCTSTSTFGAKETITAGGLAVTGGTTTDTATVTGKFTATGAAAGSPTTVTTDTWNNMTPASGWAVAPYARYRLNPDRTVEVQGVLSGGTLTNATTVWAAPAGYVPSQAFTQNIPVMVETSAGTVGVLTPRLGINSGGNLFIENIPASTTVIAFNGRYSLD